VFGRSFGGASNVLGRTPRDTLESAVQVTVPLAGEGSLKMILEKSGFVLTVAGVLQVTKPGSVGDVAATSTVKRDKE
jgi:hypothetical protein